MGNLCSHSQDESSKGAPSTGLRKEYRGVTFENLRGDISEENVDVIVSAANNRLAHHNGLANSLVVKGGVTIQEESDRIVEENDGPLSAGSVALTSGGQLNTKYVIHVVCPVWTGGEKRELEKLGDSITNALNKVEEIKAGSIAVPSLASGMFGFPRDVTARVIIKKTFEYLESVNYNTNIKLIRFVNLDQETVKCFRGELENTLRMIQVNKGDFLHPHEGPIKINGKKSDERKSENTVQLNTQDTLNTILPNSSILAALEANIKEKQKNEQIKEENNSFKENESPNKGTMVIEDAPLESESIDDKD